MSARSASRLLAAICVGGGLWSVAGPSVAFAHGARPASPGQVASAWTLDWGVVVSSIAAGMVYFMGVDALWNRAGKGRGIRRWEAACFVAGLLTLALALISPLDAMSDVLFSAHMAQHMLLIFVSAPLLVLGRPAIAFAWALPPSWARGLHRLTGASFVRRGAALLSSPPAVWMTFALGFWVWHVPVLYDAAVRHAPVHAIEHLTFIAIGMQFWWLIIRRAGHRHFPDPAAIVFVFTTMLQQTLLGALLTFSTVPWYAAYGDRAAWHLSQIADQELAGLIMWMPSNALYLVVTGALLVRWLRKEERDDEVRFISGEPSTMSVST